MGQIKKVTLGFIFTIILAFISMGISNLLPYNIISASVFALLIGMALNPITRKYQALTPGFSFVSKKILRTGIVLMGATLSFAQVIQVGKFSLFVMLFTLATAFGGGYLLGKAFNMNWKLSSLISAGTGICGGSAIAAIAPTIDADYSDIAYAISATFIFDIFMVILFPIAGHYFNMTDIGYGLWAGTAVNDTSSVVAAGYAFSDAAGNYSIIVKLTRTLSIIPTVLIFSYINARLEAKKTADGEMHRKKVEISKIFPWFIILFLVFVAVKSTGAISNELSQNISTLSKFFMVMALGAIGLNTDFKKVAKSGFKPMIHGFLISALVVVVSFAVQFLLGQL